MNVSSKDRKSILFHYNHGYSVGEMQAWNRFRFISADDMQAVIDDAEPVLVENPRSADPKFRLADTLFSGREEWERDMLMDDLIALLQDETTSNPEL